MVQIFEATRSAPKTLSYSDDRWCAVDIVEGQIFVGWSIYRGMGAEHAIGVRCDEGVEYYGAFFREVIIDNYGDSARCPKRVS